MMASRIHTSVLTLSFLGAGILLSGCSFSHSVGAKDASQAEEEPAEVGEDSSTPGGGAVSVAPKPVRPGLKKGKAEKATASKDNPEPQEAPLSPPHEISAASQEAYRAGRRAYDRGDVPGARTQLKTAIKKDPQAAEPLAALAAPKWTDFQNS